MILDDASCITSPVQGSHLQVELKQPGITSHTSPLFLMAFFCSQVAPNYTANTALGAGNFCQDYNKHNVMSGLSKVYKHFFSCSQ